MYGFPCIVEVFSLTLISILDFVGRTSRLSLVLFSSLIYILFLIKKDMFILMKGAIQQGAQVVYKIKSQNIIPFHH